MCFDAAATVAALRPWDVVYPFDKWAGPPQKHKMWVCVSRADLWFVRINSRQYADWCVALSKELHLFLSHDSFLGCGGHLISVGEDELQELLERQQQAEKQGIVGSIHGARRVEVCAALSGSPLLSPAQVRTIRKELGCPAE